jgi:hypothetical protein
MNDYPNIIAENNGRLKTVAAVKENIISFGSKKYVYFLYSV